MQKELKTMYEKQNERTDHFVDSLKDKYRNIGIDVPERKKVIALKNETSGEQMYSIYTEQKGNK